LLDEREGRRVAKSLGLKVGGVLGILLRARREGKLSSLRTAMEALQQRAGFRISADLFAWFLEESGEAAI
jgi:predicted nucleic acid-binding protein